MNEPFFDKTVVGCLIKVAYAGKYLIAEVVDVQEREPGKNRSAFNADIASCPVHCALMPCGCVDIAQVVTYARRRIRKAQFSTQCEPCLLFLCIMYLWPVAMQSLQRLWMCHIRSHRSALALMRLGSCPCTFSVKACGCM